MADAVVQLSIEDGVAIVKMNDPASHNALSRPMVAQLEETLAAASRADEARVIVLVGTDEYFSSGANGEVLAELLDGGVEPRDLLLPRAVLDAPKPVIAAMSGHAIGGGFALGLCADIVVIARESRYGANFMNYGFTPGMGITGLLEYALGPLVSHELLLTGEMVKGRRFEKHAAFNAVLPRSEVLPKSLDLAARIAEKPAAASSALKTVLSRRRRELFEAARTSEILMHKLTFHEEAVREAIREHFGEVE